MEEIVIKDFEGMEHFDIHIRYNPLDDKFLNISSGLSNIIVVSKPEARQLADAIYKLLGISIDEIKRQAFEAGRKDDGTDYDLGSMTGFHYKYDSFDDYQNREK